jgi:hypothetical protein
MKVSRPIVTIVPSPSGKRFTFRASHPNWVKEWQWLEHFDSEAKCKIEAKQFEKDFDNMAKDMESGKIPQQQILVMLRDHGKVRSRDVLNQHFIH